MLMIFVALSTAMAIVVRRPWWERLLIVLSAIPVAVLSNVVRITVTGLMHEWVGREMADLVFHDLAGWLMMPFALAVLWTELWLLEQAVRGSRAGRTDAADWIATFSDASEKRLVLGTWRRNGCPLPIRPRSVAMKPPNRPRRPTFGRSFRLPAVRRPRWRCRPR